MATPSHPGGAPRHADLLHTHLTPRRQPYYDDDDEEPVDERTPGEEQGAQPGALGQSSGAVPPGRRDRG